MPEDKKHITNEPISKENKKKKEKPKSFIETVREIDEKERKREEEIEAKRQKILEERKKRNKKHMIKKYKKNVLNLCVLSKE